MVCPGCMARDIEPDADFRFALHTTATTLRNHGNTSRSHAGPEPVVQQWLHRNVEWGKHTAAGELRSLWPGQWQAPDLGLGLRQPCAAFRVCLVSEVRKRLAEKDVWRVLQEFDSR